MFTRPESWGHHRVLKKVTYQLLSLVHNGNTQQIDAKCEMNYDTTNRVNVAWVPFPVALPATATAPWWLALARLGARWGVYPHPSFFSIRMKDMRTSCYFHQELTLSNSISLLGVFFHLIMCVNDKLSLDCGLHGGCSVGSCNMSLVPAQCTSHREPRAKNRQTELYNAENWHQQGPVPTALGSAKMAIIHLFSFKERTRWDR